MGGGVLNLEMIGGWGEVVKENGRERIVELGM